MASVHNGKNKERKPLRRRLLGIDHLEVDEIISDCETPGPNEKRVVNPGAVHEFWRAVLCL
jgi:hypothetical protein